MYVTEPYYDFIPGKGWVPTTVECRTVFDKRGQRVRLELRKPRDGEIYIHCRDPWTMNDWVNWAERSAHVFKDSETYRYPKKELVEGACYCVLTWLDT